MRSIRVQITKSLLAGLLVLAGLTGLIVYFSARFLLTVEFDHALSATARSLAMVTHFQDGEVAIDFEDELMPEFERKGGLAFFQLRLASGETIERSPSLQGADLPAHFGTAHQPAYGDLRLPGGRPARAVGIRFVPEPADEHEQPTPPGIPEATIVVARDRTALDRSIATLGALLLGAGVLALGGAAVIVHRAVARGLSPLAEIGERAAHINAGTLDTRFPIESLPGELRPIGERLNDLLARLESSFARERRFTADVAHELRTPVSELRALAEVALRWPEGHDGAAASFGEALDIARQMESIVVALLAIARCEEGRQPVQREPFDLATLVEETWTRFAPLAEARRLSVQTESTPDVTILADRDLLRIALENVFSNAIDYSPDGGTIKIGIGRAELRWNLAVTNTTPDLRPEDLSHLFERFWRKDSARTDGHHAGLGLSIVCELATLLGLELAATLPLPGTFELSLSGALTPRNGARGRRD